MFAVRPVSYFVSELPVRRSNAATIFLRCRRKIASDRGCFPSQPVLNGPARTLPLLERASIRNRLPTLGFVLRTCVSL